MSKVGGKVGGDIIALISINDRISVEEIAEKIGVSKRKCERMIAELKSQGVLSRIGSSRSGHWHITKS
ncbi:MAG: winged helix-turn-helix transcriptional regulator [Muribaculaceae bacterium]|nr:winged helix-turn-helix transcriptional regulator [Muribaculaceae bacterium]